jgi:lysophospholipase L1-like esterase
MRRFSSYTTRVILINLAVTACLILTLGIAGELYLRWYVPSADYRGLYEKKSDPTLYGMKPHADMLRQGVGIRTNSDGFRDREFKDPVGESRFSIAVLGDSYIFGQGVPQDKICPALLEKKLNESVKSDFFRVWNLGVSGYNTEQEAFLLESFVLPRAPDWVVLGYNINDYEPSTPASDDMCTNDGAAPRRTSRLQEIFDGQLLVTEFIKHRIGRLIRIFDPRWFASSYVDDILREYQGGGAGWKKVSGLLSKMNEECKIKGIGFTVAVLPAMFDLSHYSFESVHEAVLSYCYSNEIDCVDVLPYFRSKNPDEMHVSLLDGHPNALAQKIFAEAIANHLLTKIPVSNDMAEEGKKAVFK